MRCIHLTVRSVPSSGNVPLCLQFLQYSYSLLCVSLLHQQEKTIDDHSTYPLPFLRGILYNINVMKYLSLFSGIGGFELGIQQAYESLYNAHRGEDGGIKENQERNERQRLLSTEGKNISTSERSVSERTTNITNERPLCVGFSEIDRYAIATYQSHFPKHHNYGDITKINEQELPDFDMLVGGFPCQAFSIAGKRKGFEDTRGTLFFDIARIIKAKQPRLLFLENVKGLLSHDSGRTFKTIISTLTELGYDVQWQVLNSKNFGVPQNRERVFIIGHLRGTSRPEVFPLEPSNGTNAVEINILGHKDKYRRGNQVYARNAITETLSTCGGGGQHPCTLQPIANTLGANYAKGNSSSSERHTPRTEVMQNAMVRRLTPKECERLQGFPDDWTAICSDTQRYKQCGNAVTVNVIRAIAEKLLL